VRSKSFGFYADDRKPRLINYLIISAGVMGLPTSSKIIWAASGRLIFPKWFANATTITTGARDGDSNGAIAASGD